MEDFDLRDPIKDENKIRKVIFHGEKEDVILEYHQGQYIVENIFYAQQKTAGYKVIDGLISAAILPIHPKIFLLLV